MRNAYSAKVASVRLYEDTQTVSVLAVVKTENGHLIEDTFVSFYVPAADELGINLLAGLVSEIGFHATGFSKDPIRKGNPSKNLQPIHALVNLDRDSVRSLLTIEVRNGSRVTDQAALNRGRGIASRAAEWLKNAMDAARQ